MLRNIWQYQAEVEPIVVVSDIDWFVQSPQPIKLKPQFIVSESVQPLEPEIITNFDWWIQSSEPVRRKIQPLVSEGVQPLEPIIVVDDSKFPDWFVLTEVPLLLPRIALGYSVEPLTIVTVSIISPPFCVDAVNSYVAGAIFTEGYTAGAVRTESYSAGSKISDGAC